MTHLYRIKRYLSRDLLRYCRRRRRFECYGLSPLGRKSVGPQTPWSTKDKRYTRMEIGKHWRQTRKMSVSFWPGK